MQKNKFYRRFSPLTWDIRCLALNPALISGNFPVSRRALKRSYPIRILRYWFIYHFLRVELRQRQAPFNICEVGIDVGQMLRFMHSVAAVPGLTPMQWSSWTGVDCHLKQEALENLGYTQLFQENIEQSSSWLSKDYDVVILLHVLEHLNSPETAFAMIAPRMKPGSVLMGGVPSVPNFCAKIHERHIRANPNTNGHASAFSPGRVKRIALEHGMQLDFMVGAFLLRAGGFFLEDHAWWLWFNLAFGALFPAWPGEIYWVMRKPM